MKEKVIIVCPFLNDNPSLSEFLNAFEKIYTPDEQAAISFLIVDDGSQDKILIEPRSKFDIYILPLKRNLGHQKAISIGLSYIKDHLDYDKLLVMDCDGEDRPEDAFRLLEASRLHPENIIFGKRTSRKESSGFIFFYYLYRILFRILTGKKIKFGHFLIMPSLALDKIVFYNEIWNHIPGGIIKSGLPYSSIDTHRGKRYAGNSKMSFNSLLLHGLGAIAVFIDTVSVRLLIFSITTILLSTIAIITILAIKAFTDLAIPGWASTLASLLFVVLLQGFLLSLFTVFLYLTSQLQRKIIPIYDYKEYAGNFEKLTK